MTTDIARGPGRPCLTLEQILPEWDYTAPLEDIHQLPPVPELQRIHTSSTRRARFIHALCHGHTATWAARYAGNSREQFYVWKTEHPEFAAAWQNACDGAAGDIWEDRLHAISQSDKHLGAAVTATIVGLKMRKRFVENAPSGNQPVQVRIINVVRGDSASETLRIDNVPARDNVRELPSGQQSDTDTPD